MSTPSSTNTLRRAAADRGRDQSTSRVRWRTAGSPVNSESHGRDRRRRRPTPRTSSTVSPHRASATMPRAWHRLAAPRKRPTMAWPAIASASSTGRGTGRAAMRSGARRPRVADPRRDRGGGVNASRSDAVRTTRRAPTARRAEPRDVGAPGERRSAGPVAATIARYASAAAVPARSPCPRPSPRSRGGARTRAPARARG